MTLGLVPEILYAVDVILTIRKELAVISIAAGVFTFMQPAAALATLTLFLAGYFIASGVIEVIGAFGARSEKGWGWLLLGGIVSVLLGAMIWRQFPLSWVWAVGTLIGVHLIMSGWMLIMIGGMGKRLGANSAVDPA